MMRLVVLLKSEDSEKAYPKGDRKVGIVMREWKHNKLHSGSKKGKKVKSQKQAVAISLAEQRKAEGK
jgi:hypothetical protein